MNRFLKSFFPVLLLASATAWVQPVAAACPTALAALTEWFETTPDSSEVSEIRMQLTFRNDTGSVLNFSATPEDTLQIWTTPSVLAPTPLVFDAAPSGAVADGATFSYDVTGGITAPEDGFGIRPQSNLLGTLSPAQVSIVSADLQCTAIASPTSSVGIPTLSLWALLVLAASFVMIAARRFTAKR